MSRGARMSVEAALADLLDRFEAKPDQSRHAIRFDPATFSSAAEADDFHSGLRAAAADGSLRLTFGRGRDRDVVASAILQSPDRLYGRLGRRPRSESAASGLAGLRGPEDRTAVLDEVEASWAKGRPWQTVAPGDVAALGRVLDLADAILRGAHEGADYRTFSVRTVGSSKFLEENEASVARCVAIRGRAAFVGSPRETLAAVGLPRISQPLLVSGPVGFPDGGEPPPNVFYMGLPHEAAPSLRLSRQPGAVLTIENMASFHRHASEANHDRRDLVLYTGGQPSLAFKRSLRSLLDLVDPSVPVYHWSDIDEGGVRIFLTIAETVARVRPHLMSPSLAATRGVASQRPSARLKCPPGSPMREVADFLASDGRRTLEQEELDPVRPSPAASA